MKIISLKAKSSSGDHYRVEFEITDTIKVSCNCNAGIFGKLCRHKTGLLSGESSVLYDLTEEPMLEELMSFVTLSEYTNLIDEILSAKKAIEDAKKHEKKVMRTLELILKEGISIRMDN